MNQITSLPMKAVENNASAGKYTPKFFQLEQFNLSRVLFNSHFFEETDVEKEIVAGNWSFAFLRESKLRTVDMYEGEAKIPFKEFLQRINVEIRSKNLFKTGKYLSRVFRPSRYGKFFSGMDIHINNNPSLQGKVTDGISLISLELAKELGWKDAEANKSAQFTLFYSRGLVKGHCVVSDKIQHDIVVYGEQNIKDEIKFTGTGAYVAIEPVKLSTTLRMDVQSLLNLWELFGAEQFFSWARTGIDKYKDDLVNGRLAEQLDDFDTISRDDYDNEKWLLKKAIWHKLDYRRFPGLLRLAWQQYRNSLLRYAERGGLASFRIPVRGGLRGYLRVDLREHDADGDFPLDHTVYTLDRLGNLWISARDIDKYCSILGGADQDDSISVVPLENGKALLYRNPNQKGEFVITDIDYDGVEVNEFNTLVDSIPLKEVVAEVKKSKEVVSNVLIAKYLEEKHEREQIVEYSRANLLRTYSKISQNSANIGIVANAEMLRSAIGITKPTLAKKLSKLYPWNLERVIDSVVKDGISCCDDLFAVENLHNYILENNIELPKCLLSRMSEKKRDKITPAKKHPVDELLDAVKYIVNTADREILGSGSVSKGNRIPGLIDKADVPLIEIAQSNFGNPLFHVAMSLLKDYNRSMAILLDSTKDLEEYEREEKRKAGIENIQTDLLQQMQEYSCEERKLIVQSWAYEIYKSERAVHDSILWIGSTESYRGTGEDTIDMMAAVGVAFAVKKNGSVKRVEQIKECTPVPLNIRVWSKDEIRQEIFSTINSLTIRGKEVIAGGSIYNLGEEIAVEPGTYLIKKISPCFSKKNAAQQLKNSMSLLLQS